MASSSSKKEKKNVTFSNVNTIINVVLRNMKIIVTTGTAITRRDYSIIIRFPFLVCVYIGI